MQVHFHMFWSFISSHQEVFYKNRCSANSYSVMRMFYTCGSNPWKKSVMEFILAKNELFRWNFSKIVIAAAKNLF